MQVWVVCDNNNTTKSILVFKTLALAQEYMSQYTGIALEDCWIFDENGTDVIIRR